MWFKAHHTHKKPTLLYFFWLSCMCFVCVFQLCESQRVVILDLHTEPQRVEIVNFQPFEDDESRDQDLTSSPTNTTTENRCVHTIGSKIMLLLINILRCGWSFSEPTWEVKKSLLWSLKVVSSVVCIFFFVFLWLTKFRKVEQKKMQWVRKQAHQVGILGFKETMYTAKTYEQLFKVFYPTNTFRVPWCFLLYYEYIKIIH